MTRDPFRGRKVKCLLGEGEFFAPHSLCFTGTLMSNGRLVYYDVQAESYRRLLSSPLVRGGGILWRPHYRRHSLSVREKSNVKARSQANGTCNASIATLFGVCGRHCVLGEIPGSCYSGRQRCRLRRKCPEYPADCN